MKSKSITALLTPPQFIKDAIRLGNDALKWIILFSAVAAAAMGAFFLLKWYTADDNEKPAAMKKVKQVVLGAVGVVIFESVMKLVLSYFTH